MSINPFANTKASYFEDPEIVGYWVDIGKDYKDLFTSLVLPDSSIPVRILGGKGSGKTHILRYFSFNAQKLKAEKQNCSLLELIQSDGYIGVYIEATGLQANRFAGRGYTQEEWNNIFFYYMNLEFIEKSFKYILQTINSTDIEPNIDLRKVLKNFYPNKLKSEPNSLTEVYQLIRQERISLDEQISDLSVPNKSHPLEILPLFEPIEGFYNIISSALDMYSSLKGVKVLFILDEFENLSIDHQKYFNTLLRHPKALSRIALRISGRLNAKKTIDTYDDGEKLLEDSEIKTVFLEDYLSPSFTNFAHDLYLKRVTKHHLDTVNFEDSFENSKAVNKKTLKDIMQKNKGKKKYHFSELEESIRKYRKDIDTQQIDLIINNLIFEDNWLLEKANIFLLYQNWNNENLLVESEIIKSECLEYVSKGSGKLASIMEKHGNDLQHQLFRSYRRSASYSGYLNIVYMSRNNPRIFLTALNYIFKKCKSSNIDMLNSEYIDAKLQDQALIEASGWFWDNYTDDIKDHRAVLAVQKLMEFFRLLRRTPKPSEKNLVAFNLPNGLTKEVEGIIRAAVEHSLFVPTSANRSDRNSGELKTTYRIHPMLSPKWGLPLTTGGTIDFSLREANALFLNNEESWENCVKERVAKMTPPFGKSNKKAATQGTLF